MAELVRFENREVNEHGKTFRFQIAASIAFAFLVLLVADWSVAATPSPAVLAAEAQRVATIERISRPTIAIFDAAGQGGGSGVIISPDGYALSNFHVTAATGPAMKCGLADGRFVNAVLVGLDPGGDVALIKLLGDEKFPTAELGDSDACRPMPRSIRAIRAARCSTQPAS